MVIVYESEGPLLDHFKFISAKCITKCVKLKKIAKIRRDKRLINNKFVFFAFLNISNT